MTRTKSLWMIAICLLLAASVAADGQTTGCTIAAYEGRTVNGASMWVDVPEIQQAVKNCYFDQLAWNNFLYLVKDDGYGHPRFMSYAPWYDVVPASGEPHWPGYTPLSATELKNKKNKEEAGDGFHLLDVTSSAVAYDFRVNRAFFDYVKTNGIYTKAAYNDYVKSYNKNPVTGGIWLPAGDQAKSIVGAIEIKTAWRDFGSDPNACPSEIMHCEKDSGTSTPHYWGLVGLHLVQKTPGHGEFIWMSFEHVANSPDCGPNGSNPIQKEPKDPTKRGATINVNQNLPDWSKKTGWSFFNYTNYRISNGDGKSCSYPKLASATYAETTCASSSTKPLCLTDPNPSGDGHTWVQVDVCRTDQLPTIGGACTDTEDNAFNVACLNHSVINHFPAGWHPKWKYYMLIGTEWTWDGATGTGAPTKGCFSYDDGPGEPGKTRFGYYCPGHTFPESTVTRKATTHLANTVLETWMQKGICLKTKQGTFIEQDCLSCHQPPTASYGNADFSHLFDRITQAGSTKAQKADRK